MRRTITVVFVIASVLVGCDSQSTLMESMEAPSPGAVLLGKKAAEHDIASSYIIVGKGNKLPKDLKQKVEAAGGRLTGSIEKLGMAFATSARPAFPTEMSRVADVAPDLLVTHAPVREAAFSEASLPDVEPLEGAGADEPFFILQWGMNAIHAPQAWDAGVRGQGVIVAVLDEGFGLNHPDVPYRTDLAKSFACWEEIDGEIFTSNDPNDCEPPNYLLPDDFSHGSHVAGIIAAKDDASGIIGVAPDAEIMPVKVLSEVLGGGTLSWVMQGILYATDSGADVINLSLGILTSLGQGKGTNDVAHALNIFKMVIDYAVKNGVTVVVAAGNDELNADGNGPGRILPGDIKNTISISATGPVGWLFDMATNLNRPASYTNYGTSLVDFAAPGGDFTLFPNAGFEFDMVLSTGASGYYFSAGTSMAAPHAAGVAALIISENGGSMKPVHVEQQMKRRALDLGKPGKDDYYGHGLITTGY